MVSFSKPVGSLSTAENIPAKQKQILNSKLTDENNVDKEAIKWRKQEATQQGQKKTTPETPSIQTSCYDFRRLRQSLTVVVSKSEIRGA